MARRPNRREPSVSRPLPSPAREPSRGTFAVARANREIARALPDVIYSKPERPRLSAPLAQAQRASGLSSQDKAKHLVKPRTPDRENRKSLTLDKAPLAASCKARPDTSKGSGGSRPFVPWCSKR